MQYHLCCLTALLITLLVTACHYTPSTTASNSTQEAISDCRVLEHALGKSCVPVSPQRVVALDLLDNVLALGIKPIGSTIYEGQFRTLLPANRSTDIEPVGILGQPSIESVLKLKPDLILDTYWGESYYNQLSQIAPIVAAGDGETINWKAWFNTYGEALGKKAEAEEILDNYDRRIEDFREKMGERLSQTQVSVALSWDGYRVYMKQSFSGQILSDIGLPRPSLQDVDKVSEDVSLELIPKMEGDVIFLMVGGNNPFNIEQLVSHPLWSQLKAVQEGHVYQVDANAWLAGYGPVGANVVLDDLFQHLIDEWDID